MDALLVNQTDVEGGKVQDEAPVQLEERKRRDRGRNVKMKAQRERMDVESSQTKIKE